MEKTSLEDHLPQPWDEKSPRILINKIHPIQQFFFSAEYPTRDYLNYEKPHTQHFFNTSQVVHLCRAKRACVAYSSHKIQLCKRAEMTRNTFSFAKSFFLLGSSFPNRSTTNLFPSGDTSSLMTSFGRQCGASVRINVLPQEKSIQVFHSP